MRLPKTRPVTTTITVTGGEPSHISFEADGYNPERKEAILTWASMLDLKYHVDNKLRAMKEAEKLKKAPICYSDTECKGKMTGGSWNKMSSCNVCGYTDIPY